MAGVVIQSNVKIGENTLINTGALIDHHTTIGKNCHIAPGTNICGNVKLVGCVFIGVDHHLKEKKLVTIESSLLEVSRNKMIDNKKF